MIKDLLCASPAYIKEYVTKLAANIPSELKACNNWVNFELIESPKAHSGYGKKPINPHNGCGANASDPNTWGSFELACSNWESLAFNVNGVGFELGNSPYMGFDIDEIYSQVLIMYIDQAIEKGVIPDDSDVNEVAKKAIADGEFMGISIDSMTREALETGHFYGSDLVAELDTYTEISVSGRGLHVIAKGTLPNGGNCDKKNGHFEMYETGRYLTVTGDVYKGHGTLRDLSGTGLIDKYYHKYIEKKAKPKPAASSNRRLAPAAPEISGYAPTGALAALSDDDILTAAMKDGKFNALWNGDISGYPSQSEADAALCSKLAWYTDCDTSRMDRLFRRSALYRSKWDEQRGNATYGAMTINSAVSCCNGHYDPYYRSYNSTPANPTVCQPTSFKTDCVCAPPPAAPANISCQTAAPVNIQPVIPADPDPRRWSPTDWEGFIAWHYCGMTFADDNVKKRFIGYYVNCWANGLLRGGKLPSYILPKITEKVIDNTKVNIITDYTVKPIPLAQDLIESLHIINIVSIKDDLLYLYDCGKYVGIETARERGIIRGRLEAFDREAKMWNTKTIRDSSAILHSPLIAFSFDDFNTCEYVINFRNGILDLRNGELLPHSPELLSTIQLPLDYDPSAGKNTPNFDRMIDHLSSGDKETKTLLMQVCALVISNVDVGRYKMFLMIYGAKDSGKSKLFSLLTGLIGAENTHFTSLYQLEENRFEPIKLHGKRLAGHAELDNNAVVHHVGMLKALTGNDSVRAEIKNGGIYNFFYKGVIIFASNDKPRLPSADPALYERLRLVEVTSSVAEKDPKFFEKLWNERQQIVNKRNRQIPPHFPNSICYDKIRFINQQRSDSK